MFHLIGNLQSFVKRVHRLRRLADFDVVEPRPARDFVKTRPTAVIGHDCHDMKQDVIWAD